MGKVSSRMFCSREKNPLDKSFFQVRRSFLMFCLYMCSTYSLIFAMSSESRSKIWLLLKMEENCRDGKSSKPWKGWMGRLISVSIHQSSCVLPKKLDVLKSTEIDGGRRTQSTLCRKWFPFSLTLSLLSRGKSFTESLLLLLGWTIWISRS